MSVAGSSRIRSSTRWRTSWSAMASTNAACSIALRVIRRSTLALVALVLSMTTFRSPRTLSDDVEVRAGAFRLCDHDLSDLLERRFDTSQIRKHRNAIRFVCHDDAIVASSAREGARKKSRLSVCRFCVLVVTRAARRTALRRNQLRLRPGFAAPRRRTGAEPAEDGPDTRTRRRSAPFEASTSIV